MTHCALVTRCYKLQRSSCDGIAHKSPRGQSRIVTIKTWFQQMLQLKFHSLGSALDFALLLAARLGGRFLPDPPGFDLGVTSAFGRADFPVFTALSRRGAVTEHWDVGHAK